MNFDFMKYGLEELKSDEILEYLRKSRSDDPMLSVEEVLAKHEAILTDWVSRNLDTPIPSDNIYREVVSGETIDGRPEIQKLLKRIESPRIKAILVVEVQRLSRGDLEDCGRIIKLLRYTNTKVITPLKTYDLNDDYDRDAFERELKRGNEYLEYFKKIQNRGRIESVRQGNYIGSIPPYGYKKVFVMEGKKKCPTLEIVEDEAAVVRMIFDWYVNQDIGLKNICNKLDEMGIKAPKGMHWSYCALKDMVSNIHYTGKVKWNWRKIVRTVVDQEVVSSRPKSDDYLVFDGRHSAIISEELFNKAQEKKGSAARNKQGTKIRNPLASLLFCECGRAMSLRTYVASSPRLVCDGQDYCKNGSALYSEIINDICQALRDNISEFRVQMESSNDDIIQQHEQKINLIKKKLKELDSKEISLWEKYTEDNMPKHIFEQLKEKYASEKSILTNSLKDAMTTAPTPIDYQNKIQKLSDALNILTNDDISAESKNKYLKTIIARIEYRREKQVRMTCEEAKEKGITSVNGWYAPPYELTIEFKI